METKAERAPVGVTLIDMKNRPDLEGPSFVYRLVRGNREFFITHDGAVEIRDHGEMVAFFGPPENRT